MKTSPKVGALAERPVVAPVYFTGGTAFQPGLGRAIEAAAACPVRRSPLTQYAGALGAAILAGQGRSSAKAQTSGLRDNAARSGL
jgi:(R)-2-hydroxyacyl-CoA dehydratese activating ATPase